MTLQSTLKLAGDANTSDIFGAARHMIDSKAMRRIRPGESLAVVVQTNNGVGVDINIGEIRTLIGT